MKLTAAVTLTITHDDGSVITVAPAPTTRVYDLATDDGITRDELLPVVHDALERSHQSAAALLVNAAGQNSTTEPPLAG